MIFTDEMHEDPDDILRDPDDNPNDDNNFEDSGACPVCDTPLKWIHGEWLCPTCSEIPEDEDSPED